MNIGLIQLAFISQYLPSNLQSIIIGFVSVALIFIGSMIVTFLIRRFLKKVFNRNKGDHSV